MARYLSPPGPEYSGYVFIIPGMSSNETVTKKFEHFIKVCVMKETFAAVVKVIGMCAIWDTAHEGSYTSEAMGIKHRWTSLTRNLTSNR
jgi:hypothetical protein